MANTNTQIDWIKKLIKHNLGCVHDGLMACLTPKSIHNVVARGRRQSLAGQVNLQNPPRELYCPDCFLFSLSLIPCHYDVSYPALEHPHCCDGLRHLKP